ncbi:restriction endonuclease subunit S [Bacillus licheniformis]|uniref:restriction endonuclease subunit S n=1 Tax=Bacillus licheniformis TaxID=1402 RepID=UPI000FF8E4CF|nr:restriction endonuclease subunit S [Bacillus licheniformis]MEC5231985.1 restriction endonuclease subunit S [Bacillus licheniformis]QAS15143.1 restriction endonuclease subunit S [Bacillus licheniformis]
MGSNVIKNDKPEKISIPEGFKKSVVGLIPKDWEVKKFKDITDILRCGIASTPSYVEKGVPFLSSQNVKENKIILDKYNYVSEEFHKQLTKKNKPLKGDILYTRVGASFGKAAIVEFDWEFSIYVSLTLIRMKKGYNNYFYSYLLNSDRYVYNARKTVFQGGGVQNLNVKEVEKFEMVVPPLREQEKIAEILSTWDKAIELKEKLIEQKKQQKKGLMQKLLTGKVRLPDCSGEVKTSRLKGLVKEIKRRNKDNSVSRVLSVTNSQGFINQSDQFGRQVASEDLSTYKIIRKGQFAYNPSRVNVGSIDLLTQFNEGILSPMYVIFETDNARLLSSYLYHFLKSNLFLNQMVNLLQGSVRQSLSFDGLEQIKLFIPTDINEQKKIAQILSLIDKEIFLLEKELKELNNQKKGLMQLLLTGKVRVQV